MAKLRKIQFYRNGTPQIMGTHQAAISDFKGNTDIINEMLDGEILLYRYKFTNDATEVHTLVGVVHVSGDVHSLEVLANYDMLDGEISAAITAAIAELDGSATIATVTDGVVTLRTGIVQTDGVVDNIADDEVIELAKVATTGAATDVSIENTNGLFKEQTTNVQVALEEIAAEIDAMDLTATDVVALNADKTALQAGKISESDGKVSVGTAAPLVEFNQALTNGNKVATMADVAKAAELDGENAIVVTDATTENPTVVSLKLANGEKVLSQDANGLKTTLTVDTKKYTAEENAEKAGKTYIQIKGIGGEVISETDAAAFVKDGMLDTATIVKGTWTGESFAESADGEDKAIKLVWNTDAGKEAMYINAETLVDSYTSGNEWIVIDQATNKISHKTQTGLPTDAQGITDTVTGTGAYAETKTFKVPQLTVDAAGHVTTVNEKEVSITLPSKQVASDVAVTPNGNLTSTNVQAALEELQGEIDTINDINWNGDGDGTGTGEIIVNDTNHTISHKQHALQTTTSTNDTTVKSVVIPQLTVNDYGHVTAIDNKTFKIDFNVPTVSGTDEQIVVTPSNENGEDVNYVVSLATVSQNNTTAEHKFNDAEANTTKVISGVTVDNYGRVTGLQTMTIFEDYDCGQY